MTVKKILLISLGLAVVVAAIFGARQLGAVWLANRLQAAGLELQAKPELVFFPPGVNIGKLAWHGQLHKFSLQFSANAIQATPRLASLLTGRLDLEEIRIQAPTLRVTEAGSPGKAEGGAMASWPAIGRLVCQDGLLEWRLADKMLTLVNLRLTAANIIPREEFELQSDFILTIAGAGLQTITSNSALRTKARYYAPNLSLRDLHATATLTEPGYLASFSPLTLELNGSLDFESARCRIQTATLGLPGFEIRGNGAYADGAGNGEVSLTSTKPLPFATSLKLASPFVAKSGFLQLPDIAVGMDNCKGSGSLEMRLVRGALPKVAASFKMGSLRIPERTSQRKTPAQASAFPRLPPLPDFQLNLAFTEIRRGNFTITSPALEMTGDSDNLVLKQLSCQLGQGKLQASAKADFKRNVWRFSARGANLPLGSLLSEAGIPGFTDGPADLDLQFAIPAPHGQFSLPGLTGNGSLEFKNLRLAFLQGLASLLPVLGPASEISDIVKKGRVVAIASDGQLAISSFQFSGEGLRGSGEGRINLAEQTVAGSFDLLLGSLRIPLSFAGSLADPDISIDSPLLKDLP